MIIVDLERVDIWSAKVRCSVFIKDKTKVATRVSSNRCLSRYLASRCGSPMRRNSVSEELRARELSSYPGRYLLKSMLKLSDAGVENRCMY